jgi:hypothetical protein
MADKDWIEVTKHNLNQGGIKKIVAYVKAGETQARYEYEDGTTRARLTAEDAAVIIKLNRGDG